MRWWPWVDTPPKSDHLMRWADMQLGDLNLCCNSLLSWCCSSCSVGIILSRVVVDILYCDDGPRRIRLVLGMLSSHNGSGPIRLLYRMVFASPHRQIVALCDWAFANGVLLVVLERLQHKEYLCPKVWRHRCWSMWISRILLCWLVEIEGESLCIQWLLVVPPFLHSVVCCRFLRMKH